jgi:16S rRNA processing protein RimM
VIKPHGLRGEVVVNVLSDVQGRLAAGDEVILDGTPNRVVSSRPHQGRLLIVFEGFPDRTAAEALRGALVEADEAELEDEDQFYVHELVGAQVIGPDGADLGIVDDLVLLPPAAGYDLLEVTHPDGYRWLLPAADDLVEALLDDDDQVVLQLVSLPEGLLDQSKADSAIPDAVAADDASTQDGTDR